MAEAKDYLISFGYGATTPPYSLLHPHKGEDRKMPLRTPIKVNGTLVGYAGSTGESTGVHTHTQKINNSRVENPQGGGFDVPQPTTVVSTGFNDEIGNFVRYMDASGVTWSIFHMDEPAVVKVKDKLGKSMTIITIEAVVAESIATTGKAPSTEEERKYINAEATQANLDGFISYWAAKSRVPELENEIAVLKKQLEECSTGEFIETKVYIKK